MPQNRFLIVTRVGPKSLHGVWIKEAAAAGIDVVLSQYSDSPSGDIPVNFSPGVTTELRPGRKVAGYAEFLSQRQDLWQSYDYICLLDEDIATDAATLARAFELCVRNDLLLAQPALTHDSHFTYAACLAQPAFALRYVNFVEMMCPIFRKDALAQVLPLFEQGLESGIDLIWCNLLSQGPQSFAILDDTPVRHTEPVGGNKAANGFEGARSYETDISQALTRYQLPWLSAVPFAAQRRSGRILRGQFWLLGSALMLMGAVPKQPDWRRRLKFVLIHLRHILIHKPRNLPVQFPSSIDQRTQT